jgi:hypothetical protein
LPEFSIPTQKIDIDNNARFRYQVGYWCPLIDASRCWAKADADTQLTIFDHLRFIRFEKATSYLSGKTTCNSTPMNWNANCFGRQLRPAHYKHTVLPQPANFD